MSAKFHELQYIDYAFVLDYLCAAVHDNGLRSQVCMSRSSKCLWPPF
jgi:hypothetical protein